MILRDYQQECIKKIWTEINKKSSALVVASTGSGKTVIFVKFAELCIDIMKKKRPNEKFKVLILVHKVDLVKQTYNRFKQFAPDIDIGMYCGSINKREIDHQVVIGSIDSIKKEVPNVHLCIVDEVHRFQNRKSYSHYFYQLKDKNPKIKSVHFTATPYGKTGFIYGEEDSIYDEPCFQIGMEKLIADGHLVEPVFKESKDKFNTKDLSITGTGDYLQKDLVLMTTENPEKIKKQVASALETMQHRKKIMWCCTCIEHAKQVELEIMSHSERAVCVHSRKSNKRNEELTDAFENGNIRHMVSVTKLSEGTDIPCVDAVVCMRPTRSPILYVQMIGRGLRPFEGKKNCLFLDFGGVVKALGHPARPRIRKKFERKQKDRDIQDMVMCPSCYTIVFLPAEECNNCGFDFYNDERLQDKIKNLTKKAYDPEEVEKLKVIAWHINEQYTSKSTGKSLVKVSYTTMSGAVYEYISSDPGNFYYKKFKHDQTTKGMPDYVIPQDDNNMFVKERFYE